MIPGSAATTYGIAFTQCIAGPVRPISGCSPITGGCRPWNVHRERRIGVELDLEALLAERPRRIEIGFAHQPVHAHRDHGLAVDGRLPT